MLKRKLFLSSAVAIFLSSGFVYAQENEDLQALRAEVQAMKQAYENRIADLEAKLAQVEKVQKTTVLPKASTPATARRTISDNKFNPSIGVILNGQYRHFSSDEGEIAGFALGHEGERPKEGFSADHTEFSFSANVDDKFFGSTTFALAEHEGHTDVELEEAYIQTLPGAGLPEGMSLKFGRAFWTLGYLNEHHRHADDFADRPLPYRVFLDGVFHDDGVQISYLLPTEFYTEIGGGVFRGNNFPFGEGKDKNIGAWSVFARVGGDIGNNQSWRLGGYVLSGKAEGERLSNEGLLAFSGDTKLYIADLRYTWAPTGNAREQEVIFQGEYFWRQEDGIYNDKSIETGPVSFDESSYGWYAQAVYKFRPQWRVGLRYSQLKAARVPVGLKGSMLDAQGYSPKTYSVMADWTNSEFSRIRLQYNYEKLARGQDDNQIVLQYIMSLGAHGAHKY